MVLPMYIDDSNILFTLIFYVLQWSQWSWDIFQIFVSSSILSQWLQQTSRSECYVEGGSFIDFFCRDLQQGLTSNKSFFADNTMWQIETNRWLYGVIFLRREGIKHSSLSLEKITLFPGRSDILFFFSLSKPEFWNFAGETWIVEGGELKSGSES